MNTFQMFAFYKSDGKPHPLMVGHDKPPLCLKDIWRWKLLPIAKKTLSLCGWSFLSTGDLC
jgi:hypothetical protein